MIFECEPAVKLHANNIEVGTSANGNPRQDQVTMGYKTFFGGVDVVGAKFAFATLVQMYGVYTRFNIRVEEFRVALTDCLTFICLLRLACFTVHFTWRFAVAYCAFA